MRWREFGTTSLCQFRPHRRLGLPHNLGIIAAINTRWLTVEGCLTCKSQRILSSPIFDRLLRTSYMSTES